MKYEIKADQPCVPARDGGSITKSRSPSWLGRASRFGLVWTPLIVIAAIVVGPHLSTATQLKWVLWLSFGIVALSLDFVWGKAGIFSFGQNALFGIGGYAYAVVALNLFPITFETGSALIAAGLIAAAFAALLGYVMFYGQVGDVYLAIVTLAVTLVLYTIMQSTAGPEYRIGEALLGGFNGMPSLPTITLGFPGREDNAGLETSGLLIFAVCLSGGIYLFVRWLVNSRFGQVLGGLKENETRMELLGYDVRLYKLLAFTIGGAIAGVGGGLFAAWGMFINPVVFNLSQAALVVIWVMVGGRGSLAGAFLGVIIVQWISDEANLVIAEQTPLVLGIMLVLVVLAFPLGLLPALRKGLDFLLRRISMGHSPNAARYVGKGALSDSRRVSSARIFGIDVDGLPSHPRGAGHLAAIDVKKQFGGLSVLQGVTLEFAGPGIHAIIGPNGAGKSTFFGTLTGRLKTEDGRVELNGKSVANLPPFRRARLGIGIKLQVPSVFQGLTVKENLLLAAGLRRNARAPLPALRMLSTLGLERKADLVASTLSHGEQQWLEICMVLLQDPSVVLLDEPAAGMTREERVQTVELIRQLAKDHTVIVVEHDMSFIRALDAPVAMLDRGKVFRVGTFDELSNDSDVIRIYLGRRDGAHR